MVSPDYRTGLIRQTERVKRRASKFILNLPYLCDESYRDRLISLELICTNMILARVYGSCVLL